MVSKQTKRINSIQDQDMQISATQTPVITLLGNILELKNGISEIQDYLDPETEAVPLPLGVMGQIMVQQLQAESGVLVHHAERLRHKQADSWELARHSSALGNKVAALVALSNMIAQLPSYNLQAHVMAVKLTERVIESCRQIETVLKSITSTAAVVSKSKLQTA
jgi:hypothetical protein